MDLTMALIGCGRMGANTTDVTRHNLPPNWLPLSHAEAAASIREIKLVAACDIDEDQARGTAARFGIPNVYSGHQTMLAELHPALISVATRMAPRAEIIEEAIRAGVRGIHAEKPLAQSLRRCTNILGAVEASGTAFTYGTVRRFMDIYRRARGMVQDGLIGTLRHITIEFGSGALFWTHPHTADIAVFFAGSTEIDWVQASTAFDEADWHEDRGELNADPVVECATVRFANGVLATVTSGRGSNVHLGGSDGTLSIVADGTWLEWKRRSEGGVYFTEVGRENSPPAESGTARALRELIAAVQGGPPPGLTTAEVLAGARVLFGAAWSSICNGRRVRTDEVPLDFTITGRSGALFA